MYQLTDSTMQKALGMLASQDDVLSQLYKQFGVPPLWSRPEIFATLVHIILEQKVSLSSANAVMQRVCALCPEMNPSQFLLISEAALKEAGMSASKISYCRSIAASLEAGTLSLPDLRKYTDDEVIAKLTQIRGIGPWTAGVYLMMALRRPDAWASGDRALAVSYCECAGLDEVPDYASLDEIANAWKPHRASAARLLWYAYLQKRQRV